MNKLNTMLAGAGIALLGAVGANLAMAQPVDDGHNVSDDYDVIAKGQYLATLGDCAACHTLPGGKELAGGVAINTPFGKLVAPNITPDQATGIGSWNYEQFKKAMTKGVAPVGHLYGAMPYTAYTRVKDSDLQALWQYLQTVQPVSNDIKANQLPFPFNIRLSLIGWNLLNFHPGEFKPDPHKSAEWNRGAYIVEGLGHCGTCHTPKNIIGGDKNSEFLQGSSLENWTIPNITPDKQKGVGSWSTQDLVDYLKTGVNKYTIASGPMAEEVHNSSQYWSDADLKAVAVYLKEGDGHTTQTEAPKPLASDNPHMVAGKHIYEDRCSACHTPDGAGVKGLFPRLADNPLIRQDDTTSLMHVVLAGARAGAVDSRPTAPSMPAFGWEMTDQNIADVLTYIRNSWGNAAAPVSASDVSKLRSTMGE